MLIFSSLSIISLRISTHFAAALLVRPELDQNLFSCLAKENGRRRLRSSNANQYVKQQTSRDNTAGRPSITVPILLGTGDSPTIPPGLAQITVKILPVYLRQLGRLLQERVSNQDSALRDDFHITSLRYLRLSAVCPIPSKSHHARRGRCIARGYDRPAEQGCRTSTRLDQSRLAVKTCFSC